MKIKPLELLAPYSVEDLFGQALHYEKWIWVNEETLMDLFMEVLDYDSYDEKILLEEISLAKQEILDSIKEKLRKAGWIKVSQRAFEELNSDFNATEDIETHVFLERGYYMSLMVSTMRQLEWALRAMAIDTYQHLNAEGTSLKEIYKENYQENFMILEGFLAREDYEKGMGEWRFSWPSQTLTFFKNHQEHRQWVETQANFIFEELNK